MIIKYMLSNNALYKMPPEIETNMYTLRYIITGYFNDLQMMPEFFECDGTLLVLLRQKPIEGDDPTIVIAGQYIPQE